MKLRIIHTESDRGWGGQEIRTLETCRELAGRGHQVLVVCQGRSEMAKRCQLAGIPTFLLPNIDKAIYSPPAVVMLFLRFLRARPDVVHCHSSKDHWIAGIAARLLGIPVVRSRHMSHPLRKIAAVRFLYGRLADRVITSGETIRRHVLEVVGCPEDRVVSIPSGVDLERFDPEKYQEDAEKLRAEWGIPADAPVVGCVAALRGWKGQDVLIEAAALMRETHPDLRTLIVGDGPARGALQRKIGSMNLRGRVVMTGFREDVPAFLRLMDILVLPSKSTEATSQVIPQAWAMGKPVIASDAGGIPDIIEDGTDGLLVRPNDPPHLAETIGRLLKDGGLAMRMGLAGREKVRRVMGFSAEIDAMLDLYASL